MNTNSLKSSSQTISLAGKQSNTSTKMKSLYLLLACFSGLNLSQPKLSAKVNVTEFSVSVSKTEIVAATLIAEAGGEKDSRALYAVAEVIYNRSISRKISPAQVCLQPKQFSCWNGKQIETEVNKAKKHKKWANALKIAQNLGWTNYTKNAQFYHTTKVNPSWNKKMLATVTIENHKFYK
jgi:spore germination cell wall hydrolase CwlJ-like protein